MAEAKQLASRTAIVFLLLAMPARAIDPAGIAVLPSGQVTVLDAWGGVLKLSGNGTKPVVPNFGVFVPVDFVTARIGRQESILVTLRLERKVSGPFSRLGVWTSAGQKTAEYAIGDTGGALAGVDVDAARLVAYCSDSQLGKIYRVDLRSPKSPITTFASIRDAGALGPLVIDSQRARLLVADVRQGRILAVSLADGSVKVVLGPGQIREPLGLALDGTSNRLFIADATKERVWVGTIAANGTITVTPFNTPYRFHEPVGVAVAGTSIWVVDREERKAIEFAADGTVRRQIGL